MSCILGIDPGSRVTGFGLLRLQGRRAEYLACGCIRVRAEELPQRLGEIFSGVDSLVEQYQPEVLAIERVFMHRNADSALKLGQARGAAIVAAVQRGLAVYEYAPTAIKQAVVGRGHADKTQVQHMVKVLLGLERPPQADAADALAVALCHAHTRQSTSYFDARHPAP